MKLVNSLLQHSSGIAGACSFLLLGLSFCSTTFAKGNSNISLISQQSVQQTMQPPVAKKIVTVLEKHGHKRTDEFYWMNERSNPDVVDYLNAENAYMEQALAPYNSLRKSLFEEMKSRIKQDDMSVPYRDNGYYYYVRYEEGKEYPLYCRKKGSLDAPEEIMLNGNLMAGDNTYFSIGGFSVSPDNNLLGYSIDTVGRRQYTIYVKNLTTGETFSDVIPNSTGSLVWANDNATFFFTKKDSTLRSYRIMRHKLGETTEPEVVFEETDPTYSVSVYASSSRKFLIIYSNSTLTTESRIIPADNPNAVPEVFAARQRGIEYSVNHAGSKFFVLTNKDNAKNFKLLLLDDNLRGFEQAQELIPHRPNVRLESFKAMKEFLAIEERSEGLLQLRIIRREDGSEHYLDFGEEAYTAYLDVNREYDTKEIRFGYSSMTTPLSIYSYNMESRQKNLLKQHQVLGDFSSANYHTKRLFAKATDGTMVPISLVYRKDMFKKDGSNPCLLYGYGSYGATIDPMFSSSLLSLLDRGFVYAIAHIRGGEFLGRSWYEDGKLLKKKNTFTDFINVGEFLVAEKYTSPNVLFANGGSAGGLLMGAVANMRPDLFHGIVADVPFVDVVTTMLDESIPLTTGEFDEWGNPADKEYYDYMLSYSPYDNVERKNYPNMLVTSGFHDSQVQYWEPTKWVARLRDRKTDNNALYLYTNMEAGHSGASGRFRRLEETALTYTFILSLLQK